MPVELDLVVHIVTKGIASAELDLMAPWTLVDVAMTTMSVFLGIVTTRLKSVENLNLFA